MPEQRRATCVGGAQRAMRVEGGQAYLSDTTVQRLSALVRDPDREVRSSVRLALFSGATVDDAYVDLLSEAGEDTELDVRTGWYVGMQRIGADVERAVAVAERLTTAPVPTRREGCQAIALWEAEAQLFDSLQSWEAQETDPATKACLGEVVTRHAQRLTYLKANAPALARVRALELLVEGVTDMAQAVPQVREALRDADALVRVAGLRLVVDWTIGQLEFDVDETDSFGGLGVPALRTVTLDDFSTQIAALMNDTEPGIQGVAMELFSKADLMRQLGPRLQSAELGPSVDMPTLSPPVVARLSSVPATADAFVRQVAARTLLRYAPVDAAHITRVIEGLTSAQAEIAEEAASSIQRLGSHQRLLTSFMSRIGRLAPSARHQAVQGVATLLLIDDGRDRLEAWAKDEGTSPLARDLRALLDELPGGR
ncbi:hypothetical protein [Luteitalea pratensis]|nr:hypothetical protein [Luteitalea pratensis]